MTVATTTEAGIEPFFGQRLGTTEAEALFASDVQMADNLTNGELIKAIEFAMTTYGGVRGCAAEMAERYAHDPVGAQLRMRWANRKIVQIHQN